MADAPKILGTDTLRSAYPKLNSAIDNANEAINKHHETDLKADSAVIKANQATATATQANSLANDVQTQLNTIVLESGTSDAEVIQARGDKPVLNERLNDINALLSYSVAPYQNHHGWFPSNFTKLPVPIPNPADIPEMGFPTVIKVKELIPNPIDNYYMWASPHDYNGGGLYLYTAPSPTGPWTLYPTRIFGPSMLNIPAGGGHVSSFHVMWIPEEQRFYFYLHATGTPGLDGQSTFLAFSNDGVTNFTMYSTNPIIKRGELGEYDYRSATYFRVFRKGGDWFGYYQTEDYESNERVAFAYSPDGKTWTKYASNPVLGPSIKDGETLEATYLPTPFLAKDTCYLLFVARRSSDSKLVIKVASTLDGVNIVRKFTALEPSATEWDSYDVTYPYVMIDGGRIYLYYVGNNVASQTGRKIGIAYAELGDKI